MHPPLGWVTIRSQMHGKVLYIYGKSSQEGTKVVVWTHLSPPENNQTWRFQVCAHGWYRIVSALRPNLVLDVAKDSARLISVYNRKSPPESNQMFRLKGNRLESALGAGLVVDIEGANTNDGANVILSSQNDAVDQAFLLRQVGGSWTAPLEFDPVESWVMIRSQMHGKVLDVKKGKAKAGTSIIILPPKFFPNQKWRFEPCGNGWCHIVSTLDPNLVLDVEGGEAELDSSIILSDRRQPAEARQMFRVKGQCIESALGARMVLDIACKSQEDGARLLLFLEHDYGTRNNQSFVLQSVGGP